jgi:hypothetical protein
MFKKIISTIFVLVLLPLYVEASPFLVCDPQAGAETYAITGDTFFPSSIVAQTDGSLKFDLETISVGTHSITVAACTVWGCSAAVPFAFTRANATSPVRIKITK